MLSHTQVCKIYIGIQYCIVIFFYHVMWYTNYDALKKQWFLWHEVHRRESIFISKYIYNYISLNLLWWIFNAVRSWIAVTFLYCKISEYWNYDVSFVLSLRTLTFKFEFIFRILKIFDEAQLCTKVIKHLIRTAFVFGIRWG